MGRFGALDGLLMLGLHLGLTGLSLWLGRRAGAAVPAHWRTVSLAAALLLSFLLAFIAHVVVLNLLKQGWPLGFESVWIKRPLVAIAWAGATAGGLRLALRPQPAQPLLWLGALGSALAYLVFAIWRA